VSSIVSSSVAVKCAGRVGGGTAKAVHSSCKRETGVDISIRQVFTVLLCVCICICLVQSCYLYLYLSCSVLLIVFVFVLFSLTICLVALFITIATCGSTTFEDSPLSGSLRRLAGTKRRKGVDMGDREVTDELTMERVEKDSVDAL
jgi:hypothetical protein